MIGFILWCILFCLCWPLALLALIVYPIVWLILLPFRIAGIAVHGVLSLLRAIFFLPARLWEGLAQSGRARTVGGKVISKGHRKSRAS